MKKLLIIILIAPLFCFGQKDSSKLEKAVFISTGISQYNSIPIYEFRYREKINWYNNIGFQLTYFKKGKFSLQTALAIERTVFFNKQNDPYYFYSCAKRKNNGPCEEEAHHEFSLKSVNINIAVIPQLELVKEKFYLGMGVSVSKIIYSSINITFLDYTNQYNYVNQKQSSFWTTDIIYLPKSNLNISNKRGQVLLPNYFVNGILQFNYLSSKKSKYGINISYSFLMNGAREYEFGEFESYYGVPYKLNLLYFSYAYSF